MGASHTTGWVAKRVYSERAQVRGLAGPTLSPHRSKGPHTLWARPAVQCDVSPLGRTRRSHSRYEPRAGHPCGREKGQARQRWPELIQKKLREFVNSLRRHQSLIFCVRCGSTRVEVSDLTQLLCHSWGNRMQWDGLSFGLARSIDRHCQVSLPEVERSLVLRERTPPWIEASEVQIRSWLSYC